MKLSEWYIKMSDSVESRLAKINNVAEKTAARFVRLQDQITTFGQKIRGAANQVPFLGQALSLLKNPVALLLAAGVAAGSLFYKATDSAANYQQSIAEVSAITGIAGKDLQHLSDQALTVGRTSGLGAAKAAEAYKLLASNIDIMSIGGVKALDELQQKTILLAQAAQVDLPTAANTMAASINQFSLNASDAGRVINALAAGAKYGAAEIPDLAESLKLAGTTASLAKVNIEQTVGALEILSQNALKGGEAGTQLRNILIFLQTRAIPGTNLATDGLAKTLQKLKPHLKDTAFLAHHFGRENISAAQILIKNAAAVGEMTKKVTGTNVAYEQAKIQTETYQGTLNRLKATVDVLFIKLGSTLLPPLTNAFNWLLSHLGLLKDIFKGIWEGIKIVLSPLQLLNNYVGLTIGLIAAFVLVVWALNAAWAANPIGFIVAGIILLTATIYTLWQRSEKFRGFLLGLWGAVKQVFSNIWEAGKKYLGGLGELLVGIFTLDIDKIKSGLKNAFGAMADVYKKTGAGVAEKFNSGFAEGTKQVRERLGAEKTKDAITGVEAGMPNAYAANAPQGKKESSIDSSMEEGVGNISSGGRSVKNITVNIAKLIEGFTIQVTELKQSRQEVQRIIEETVLRAIQGAELNVGT